MLVRTEGTRFRDEISDFVRDNNSRAFDRKADLNKPYGSCRSAFENGVAFDRKSSDGTRIPGPCRSVSFIQSSALTTGFHCAIDHQDQS